MNKNILYIVGGVVVVGAVIALTMMKPASIAPAPGETGTPDTASQSSGMKSLKDLFALGASQKCTFTNKTGDYESSGVVYTAGGKMRGDFTTLAAGKSMQSHMIVEGDTSYVWTGDSNQGMKMSFTDVSSSVPEGTPKTESVDINQKTEYDCSAWITDTSMFALPNSVQFTDLSAMMKGATSPKAGAGVDLKAMQCGYCAQAGDADSVAQCKAALGCK